MRDYPIHQLMLKLHFLITLPIVWAFLLGFASANTPNILKEAFGLNNGAATVPVLSSVDFHDFFWSNQTTILQHSSGQVIYRNYTTFYKNGSPQSRWTRREYTDNPDFSFALQRRGFLKNPSLPKTTWNWLAGRLGDDCATPIPYCFKDQKSKDAIGPILKDALAIWYKALGNNHGVVFLPDPAPFCDTAGRQVVNIMYASEVPGEATVGYLSGSRKGAPQNFLKLDPDEHPPPWNDFRKSPTEALVHELGHILGLEHEHQRPGASDEITFQCDVLSGYETVVEHLKVEPQRKWPEGSDRTITIEDICSDFNLAADYLYLGFTASAYIPLPASGDLYKIDGPLDRESVMLYGGAAALSWKDGTGGIKVAHSPSVGDVRAVKLIFPDVGTPESERNPPSPPS